MAIPTDPNTLAALSTCYRCIAEGDRGQVLIYILADAAGLSGITASELMALSKCYCGIPEGDQAGIFDYLMTQIANGGGTPCEELFTWEPESEDIGSVLYVSFVDTGITEFQTILEVLQGIDAQGATTIEVITLTNVTEITGGVFIDGATALTSFTAPLLESTPEFLVNNNPALTSLSFPALTEVGNDCFIQSNANLTSISMPSLQTVGNDFTVEANPDLLSVDVGDLVSTGGGFDIFDNAALTSITASSLQTVGDFLGFDGCPQLTSLNLSTVTSVGSGGIIGNGCTNLSSLNISGLTALGGNFRVDGCALPSAQINAILAQLVSIVTYGAGKTVNLSGGTNGAPSGQGIVDKATLQGRGATVNTN